MTDDEITAIYSKLCDYHWRREHPETPDDGLIHTSDESRKFANDIMKIVGLWERNVASVRRHLEKIGPEGRERLRRYASGEDFKDMK